MFPLEKALFAPPPSSHDTLCHNWNSHLHTYTGKKMLWDVQMPTVWAVMMMIQLRFSKDIDIRGGITLKYTAPAS